MQSLIPRYISFRYHFPKFLPSSNGRVYVGSSTKKTKAKVSSQLPKNGGTAVSSSIIIPPLSSTPTSIPWSKEHEHILWSNDAAILTTGVAGCGKTELLIRLALRHVFLQQRKVIVATLVSSVRDDIAYRINQLLPRPVRLIGTSHKERTITASLLEKAIKAKPYQEVRNKFVNLFRSETQLSDFSFTDTYLRPGGMFQISTIDGIIHQSLMKLSPEWLSVNNDRHTLKVKQLNRILSMMNKNASKNTYDEESSLLATSEVDDMDRIRRYLHAVPFMRNGDPADVILIDEYQDVDPERALIISRMIAQGTHRCSQYTVDKGMEENHVSPASVSTPFFQGLAVGDTLQSVFDHALESGREGHPFHSWVRCNPFSTISHINTCFRCPPSHLSLTNLLTKTYQISEQTGSLQVSPYWKEKIQRNDPSLSTTDNHPRIHTAEQVSNESTLLMRPILFAHESTTNNAGATDVATRVVAIIESYMDMDSSLRPDDVAVIMAKVNNNAVMGALENTLEYAFEQRYQTVWKEADESKSLVKKTSQKSSKSSKLVKVRTETNIDTVNDLAVDDENNAEDDVPNHQRKHVHYFVTENEDGRMTIKWSRSKNKAALCSVHAIKGRSARLVVFVGVTEGSIPREARVHEVAELVDISLLNVGLTRSTQYLAVGMASRRPSRYLTQYEKELENLALCTWNVNTCRSEKENEFLNRFEKHITTLYGLRHTIPVAHNDSIEESSVFDHEEDKDSGTINSYMPEPLQLNPFVKPDWNVSRTYLQCRSGRPEHLIFPVRRLADRQQKCIDGDIYFDPSLWTRIPVPGLQAVPFPSAVDIEDDLIACGLGILGEISLRIQCQDTSLRYLQRVLENIVQNTTDSTAGKDNDKSTELSRHYLCHLPHESYDIVYTNNEKALAQWWDTGVNERILAGDMAKDQWKAFTDDIYLYQQVRTMLVKDEAGTDSLENLSRRKAKGSLSVTINDVGNASLDSAVYIIEQAYKQHTALCPNLPVPLTKPILLADLSVLKFVDHERDKLHTSLHNFYTGSPLPSLQPQSVWSIAILYMLLTQRIRRSRLADLLLYCPPKQEQWWPNLVKNIQNIHQFIQSSGKVEKRLHFNREVALTIKETDPKILEDMTIPSSRSSIGIGVRGIYDMYDEISRTLYEIKVSMNGYQRYPAPLWATQSVIYSGLALPKYGNGTSAYDSTYRYSPRRICIIDLGGGSLWMHNGRQSKADTERNVERSEVGAVPGSIPVIQQYARNLLRKLLLREKYRPDHIDRLLT